MNARRASALARSLSLHSARRPRPYSNNITAFACPSPTPRSLSSPRAPINPPSYMVFQAARPLRPTSSSSTTNSTNTNNNTSSSSSSSLSNNVSNPLLHSQSDQSDQTDSKQHHSLTITSNSTNDTNHLTDSVTTAAAAAVAAATAVVTSHHFPINSQHAHSEIISDNQQQSYSSSSIDEQNDTNTSLDIVLPDSIQSSETKQIDEDLSTSTVSSTEHSTDSDQSKLNNNHNNISTNDAGAGGRTISSTQNPIPNTPPSFTFHTGVVSIPHPDKAEKGGEDAFFVQKHAMGVFDGVGGWASIGVDAGLYSKELARLTAAYVTHHGTNCIVEALKNAAEQNHAIGTSTACVAAISNAHLIGINLGDSGLLVIRDGQIIYQTTEQQHYFNCPYQIGTDSLDTVDVGTSIDVPLRHGDWIIMGTDGLWDNVFAANVVELIRSEYSSEKSKPTTEKHEDNNQLLKSTESSEVSTALSDCSKNDSGVEEAQTISQKLAEMALKVANDERSNSPFAVNAQNAGHLFMGGKIDDITIISALVVDPTLEDSHLQTTTQEDSNRPNGLPTSNL